jgi:hypothetical protein
MCWAVTSVTAVHRCSGRDCGAVRCCVQVKNSLAGCTQNHAGGSAWYCSLLRGIGQARFHCVALKQTQRRLVLHVHWHVLVFVVFGICLIVTHRFAGASYEAFLQSRGLNAQVVCLLSCLCCCCCCGWYIYRLHSALCCAGLRYAACMLHVVHLSSNLSRQWQQGSSNTTTATAAQCSSGHRVVSRGRLLCCHRFAVASTAWVAYCSSPACELWLCMVAGLEIAQVGKSFSLTGDSCVHVRGNAYVRMCRRQCICACVPGTACRHVWS